MAERNKAPARDVALLYAPTDDGKGARVIRSREGQLETGEIRPMREGQPLNQGELIRLSPRAEAPCVCDVEVLHARPAEAQPAETPAAEPSRAGPAQVASDDYRMNWDRIFGAPTRRARRDRSLN